jgi:hypothetical protein
VTVLSATEESAARNVAVLVDVSGSQGGRAGQASWRAAEDLVHSLTPRHRVVVLTVGATVTKHSELTSDRQSLQEAVRTARARVPWGPSSLYDGVLQTTLGFRGTGLGNVVCLFSDGEDTSSTLQRDALEKALAATGVRVFVVRTERDWPSADSPTPSHEAQRWTTSVTEATGGSLIRLERSHGIAEALPQLLSSIQDVYRLEVAFPRAVDKLRRWKLEVTEPDGLRRRDVRLLYPRSVAPR